MTIITLTEYKQFQGINNATQDLRLQPLVDATNEVILRYCQTHFGTAVAEGVRLDAYQYTLLLPKCPIHSVEYLGIKRNSTLTEELVKDEQFLVHPEEGSIELIDSSIVMPSNRRAFVVDYTYGQPVPYALKQAANELITYYHKREFNKSKDLGTGQSIDFTDSSVLPPQIRTILDMYRVL